MRRIFCYPGQIPLDTDELNTNKNALLSIGKLSGAILGTAPIINGLACSPTGPASLQVMLGTGEMYVSQQTDAAAYGSLGTDTTSVVKQGIQGAAVAVSGFSAPGSAGQSINYLIEVQVQELDLGSVTLNYFNVANPQMPFAGPNNTNTAQPTYRDDTIAIQVKVGIAATTGTQVTPTPDSGWTPLWVVTVANGQTTIVSGNIAQYPNAAFLSETLLQKVSLATVRATANTFTAPQTFNAGIGRPVTTFTSTESLTQNQSGLVLINAAGGNITLTLPLGSVLADLDFDLVRIDTSTNTVTIACAGSDTFATGVTSLSLPSPGGRLSIQSDGASPATWRQRDHVAIVPNAARLRTGLAKMVLGALTEGYLGGNLDFDGTNFNRQNAANSAAALHVKNDSTLELLTAAPGANPISAWTSNPIWSALTANAYSPDPSASSFRVGYIELPKIADGRVPGTFVRPGIVFGLVENPGVATPGTTVTVTLPFTIGVVWGKCAFAFHNSGTEIRLDNTGITDGGTSIGFNVAAGSGQPSTDWAFYFMAVFLS